VFYRPAFSIGRGQPPLKSVPPCAPPSLAVAAPDSSPHTAAAAAAVTAAGALGSRHLPVAEAGGVVEPSACS